jgi:hypothetical protein
MGVCCLTAVSLLGAGGSVYLIAGTLYNRRVRHLGGGARDWASSLPHRQFWLELYALVRDGVAFTRGRLSGGARLPQRWQRENGGVASTRGEGAEPLSAPGPGQQARLELERNGKRTKKAAGAAKRKTKEHKRALAGKGAGRKDRRGTRSGGDVESTEDTLATTTGVPSGNAAGGGRWVRVVD